jgi:Zn ribbon nucleic-acid-binding protein
VAAQDPAAGLVAPSGNPARQAAGTNCPRCNADKSKRVLSSGFGVPHDCCSNCGHEWSEGESILGK